MTADSDGTGRILGPDVPSVIAHRGASKAFPENTIAAFEGAAALGADWVEFDVRRTADPLRVVVHHDAVLPDGRVLVETETDLPDSVPRFVDVLQTCLGAGLGMNIEIKSDPSEPDFDPTYRVADDVVRALGDVVATTPDILDRVLVTSFDPGCIARVHERDPAIATGHLRLSVRDAQDARRIVEKTAAAGHVAVNPLHHVVEAELVQLAHDAGLRIYPWTVDDPERMRALVDLGVDGIITNVPDVLRAILTA